MYAIVANCHYNGLSIIQELGRHGVDVRALDSARSIGTRSKYATFVRCPDPSYNENAFIAFLIKYGAEQHDRGVLFPTNDQWAVAISKHRNVLHEFFELVAPPFQAIEIIIEKYKFYQWAQGYGYPVPKTWRLESVGDIPCDVFPVVVKPEFRRTASNDICSLQLQTYLDQNRFHVANRKRELESFVALQKEYARHFVVQQYVRGLSDAMFTVGVYADRTSKVRGIFSGRKVRGFPPDHGDCILGQVETVPAHVINITKEICETICYSGIAEFEFKRDAATGQYILIEINPRSWSWIGITPACGVSLAWLAFQDLAGDEIPALTISTEQDGQVKYVKILQDFENCIWRNKRAGHVAWSFSVQEWRRTLAAEDLVVAEYQPDDLCPTFYAITGYVRRLFSSIGKGLFKRRGLS
jgi:D-aspartate ligase